LFDCDDIDSEINESGSPSKVPENCPIVSISERSEIRSDNFGNHETKECRDNSSKELSCCIFDDEFMRRRQETKE
jgi:hypothetical protein